MLINIIHTHHLQYNPLLLSRIRRVKLITDASKRALSFIFYFFSQGNPFLYKPSPAET